MEYTLDITPGKATNKFSLLAIRPEDFIHQCIKNSGSSELSIVTMEAWRLISQIIFDLEPGQLPNEKHDYISALLFDLWGIMFVGDIEAIINHILKMPNQKFTSINLIS